MFGYGKKGGNDRFYWIPQFIHEVLNARDTPSLIRAIAMNGQYMRICRKLAGSPEKQDLNWIQEVEKYCKQKGISYRGLVKKISPVARSLGLKAGPGDRDYYEILGVKPQADQKEIKSAFRKKALKLHPDVNKDKDSEYDEFISLKTAFQVLSNPGSRNNYDRGRFETWNETINWFPAINPRKKNITNRWKKNFLPQMLIVILVLGIITLVADFIHKESIIIDDCDIPASIRHLQTRRSSSEENAGVVVKGISPKKKSEKEAVKKAVEIAQVESGSESGMKNDYQLISETQYFPADRNPGTSPAGQKNSIQEESKKKAAKEPFRSEWEMKKTGKKTSREADQPETVQKAIARNSLISSKKTTEKIIRQMQPVPVSGQKEIKKDNILSASGEKPKKIKKKEKNIENTEKRLNSFLGQLARAYESENIDVFQSFFSENALENGKSFKSLLPVYRKTFRTLNSIRYILRMKNVEYTEQIKVTADFILTFRLEKSGDSLLRKGDIFFEIEEVNEQFRIKNMTYHLNQNV